MFSFLKYLFLILILLIAGAIYFLGFTETGLVWEVAFAMNATGKQLQIQKAHGKLFSDFILEGISYQNDSQQMTIQKLDIAWNPDSLLLGKIIINHLIVDTAHIKSSATATTRDTSSKPIDLKIFDKITIQTIKLKNINVLYNDINLQLDLSLDDQWRGEWRLDIPNLSTLHQETQGAMVTQGKLTGSNVEPIIDLSIDAKKIHFQAYHVETARAHANFNLTDKARSRVDINASDIKINNQVIKRFDATLLGSTWAEQKTRFVSVKLDILKKYFAAGIFKFPQFTYFTDLNQPMSAAIDVSTTNLDFLTTFVPVIQHPSASFKANLKIEGRLNKPTISAEAYLHQGRVYIPDLRVELTNISLQASLKPNYTVAFAGDFNASKGHGQIQGEVDLTQDDYPVNFTLTGKDLTILKLPEYRIQATPDLLFTWKKNIFDIQGKIFIPSARINPKNLNTVVTLPSDVIYVQKQNTKKVESPFDLTMRLALSLGDDIQINYNDLKTQLKGSLEIRQELKGLPQGYGELYTSKGTYKAFDQVFDIQEGRIIFTGGLITNPGLDVRAMKNVKVVNLNAGTNHFSESGLQSVYTGRNSLEVGVQVRGTANNPSVSLISNPAGLSKNDILSYLLFGFPQSQISGQQTGTLLSLLSAINSNNKSQLSNIPNTLKETFSLSEFNIKSMDVYDPTANSVKSNTSVVVGKQLGDKLSVHISKSLFDSTTILNLRYKLTKYFFVQSETSSVDNGGDLVYEIEFD